MALKGTKNIALSYQSMIGDQVAVYMTAQIPESGRSNSSKTIQDLDLYEANKTECREDMAAFDEMLFELEDQQTSIEEETPEESGENQGMEEIQ